MAFTNILYTTNVYRCRSGNKCSNYSSLLADLVSEQKSKTEAFASREPVPHGEKSHQWSPTVIMKQKKVQMSVSCHIVIYSVVTYFDSANQKLMSFTGLDKQLLN